MKIRVQLPRPCEGKVHFDRERMEIIIEPYFLRRNELLRCLYFSVEGSGPPKLSALQIFGSNGKLRLLPIQPVACQFDDEDREGKTT
jgi:hypothetical protein